MSGYHIGELDHECVSDHQLHKANRLAHRVAGLLLESYGMSTELWTAIDNDAPEDEYREVHRKVSEKNDELEAAADQYKQAMEVVDA